MKKKSIFGFLAVILLVGTLTGCGSKSKKVVSYMEKRYDTKCTYLGRTNMTFGDKDSFTARLSCGEFDNEILVTYYEGKNSYADNYMAVYYHDDAYQKIDQAIKGVLTDYQLIFEIPDLVLTIEDPSQYTLEDYLQDLYLYKSVAILTSDNLTETTFQSLMNAFRTNNISLKGLVATPYDKEVIGTLQGNSDVQDLLANSKRVKTQVNFSLEDGTITSEDWRQL